MNQEDIAAMFRRNELENRARRRAALLRNEAALEDEPLDLQAQQANTRAVAAIQRQQEVFEQTTRVGYWKRLWWALTNKRL